MVLTPTQTAQLQTLLDLADDHPEYKGYGLVKGHAYDAARIPILDGQDIVGFFTPRFDRGYWRAGAIFVSPNNRGKGHATGAIKQYFGGNPNKRPARVWIATYNTPSQNAFAKAGFVKGDYYEAGNKPLEQGHYYYLVD